MIINITTFDLLLRDRGMTQAALAQRARLGTKTIGRIRRGEELRIANAKKIAVALGVSLDELQLPPSEKLQERAGKKSGLNRLVADLSSQSLNALTLASLHYKVPEKTILEVGPYLFIILAQLSLKRRLDELLAWRATAMAAVEEGPRREWPTIDSITTEIQDLVNEEFESIKKRDLSGGFSGPHPEVRTKENPGHPFLGMLQDMASDGGDNLWFYPDAPSANDFVPLSYDAQATFVDEFLDPEGALLPYQIDEDACLLIADGQIPLRDMPEDLLASGSGPDRRAWVINHPNYGPYGSRIDDTDEVTVAEDSQRANDAGNGGSNA
jgi:transcriptional regulator with XRE-family HTH domain